MQRRIYLGRIFHNRPPVWHYQTGVHFAAVVTYADIVFDKAQRVMLRPIAIAGIVEFGKHISRKLAVSLSAVHQHGNALGGNPLVCVDYQYILACGVCNVYVAGGIKAVAASVEDYELARGQIITCGFAQTVVNNDYLKLTA